MDTSTHRYYTSHRRLTKRANEFFGLSLVQYILTFAYMNHEGLLVFNENATMKKAFAVWVSHGDNQKKLTRIIQNR
jgi:hypothetical protein|tara:strand:+ start:60 stop:287 length:228 start_codon:yes stop_codon:yes gene_type:complete